MIRGGMGKATILFRDKRKGEGIACGLEAAETKTLVGAGEGTTSIAMGKGNVVCYGGANGDP